MSVAIRLGAAAALLGACTIDISDKTACNATTDCVGGYTCFNHRCMPSGGPKGGNGGNPGLLDGGADALPPRNCMLGPVTECPGYPGTTCEKTFCGGHLWRNANLNQLVVRYRIQDPDNRLSPGYRGAIRAAADAWTRSSSNFVVFQECTNCSGTGPFITVIPGDEGADGIMNPDDMVEQFLPMPVSGPVSPHRIAHQWGHVVGLAHTYERADRDRYVGFDPVVWCPPLGTGLPPHCAAGPGTPPGIPPVTTGTFGAFDYKSKMNDLPSQGVCGGEGPYEGAGPDEDSGEPTIGDISAAAELFADVVGAWSPFRPIGRSVSPMTALDYQLAPYVDPVGAPAIAEVEYASPEIFVRGADDLIYTTTRSDLLTSDWLDWTPVPDRVSVDADPAVTFSYLTSPETLFLAARFAQDGNIHLRARRAGTWGDWMSLGAPSSGAASAPVLASESPTSLAVLVRGGDGLIYELACMDANVDCSASSQGAWQPLPPPPSSGIFVGKPAATWLRDASGLTVAAITDDRVALVMTRVNAGGGTWLPADTVDVDLSRDDPQPGVAIAMSWIPGELDILAANYQGILFTDARQSTSYPIGGVLASPPSAVAIYGLGGLVRTDVAAIIDDHGHPGVWWRYNDGNYVPPCHYNSPTACLQCGLDQR